MNNLCQLWFWLAWEFSLDTPCSIWPFPIHREDWPCLHTLPHTHTHVCACVFECVYPACMFLAGLPKHLIWPQRNVVYLAWYINASKAAKQPLVASRSKCLSLRQPMRFSSITELLHSATSHRRVKPSLTEWMWMIYAAKLPWNTKSAQDHERYSALHVPVWILIDSGMEDSPRRKSPQVWINADGSWCGCCDKHHMTTLFLVIRFICLLG